MYGKTKTGLGMWSFLPRLPQISRPTKEQPKLVRYNNEARSQGWGLRFDGSVYEIPSKSVLKMTLTQEELIDKISTLYDADDFIDILNINTEQLATAFIDLVVENVDKFERLEEYNENSKEEDS